MLDSSAFAVRSAVTSVTHTSMRLPSGVITAAPVSCTVSTRPSLCFHSTSAPSMRPSGAHFFMQRVRRRVRVDVRIEDLSDELAAVVAEHPLECGIRIEDAPVLGGPVHPCGRPVEELLISHGRPS